MLLNKLLPSLVSQTLDMSKLIQHFILIVLFLGQYAPVTAQEKQPLFSKPQLMQDYEIFVRALKEAHPGLYRYTPKKEMDALFAQTKSNIRERMTEEQFYKLLMPLIVKIRCGHTKWFRKDKTDDRYAFYDNNLFPLKLHFVDEKAYVVENYSGKTVIEPKSEIISIDGKTIPQIRRQINRFIPADGYVQSFLNEELNHFFNGYYATFVSHQPNYVVTYKKNEKRFTQKVQGISLQAIQTAEQKRKSAPKLPLRLQHLDAYTAILTIERFFIPREVQDFYSFIDSTFLDLKNKKIENLIIDVRNNEGGEESFGGYLFSYLATEPFQYYKKITVAQKEPFTFLEHAWVPPPYEGERKKLVEKDGEVQWLGQPYLSVKQPHANAFKGKVYILTNGLSFSVTSEFASVVHHHKRATFIGGETAGAYYGDNSGVFTVVTLPNTKLGMGIPLLGFHSNVSGYLHKDRGIIPDFEVKRSVSDVINGKDPEMDFTLKVIEQTRKGEAGSGKSAAVSK